VPLRAPSRGPSALSKRARLCRLRPVELSPLPQTVVAVALPGRDRPLGVTGEASPLTARGVPAGLLYLSRRRSVQRFDDRVLGGWPCPCPPPLPGGDPPWPSGGGCFSSFGLGSPGCVPSQ
jgi:hypothetical protein